MRILLGWKHTRNARRSASGVAPMGVALLLFCSGFLYWHDDHVSAPCLFSEPFQDFGKTGADTLIQHKFVFRNVGEEPLQIRRVIADCGCLAHSLEKQDYTPGESGAIDVQLNTSGIAPPASVTKRLTVEYEYGGVVCFALLKMMANVEVDFHVEPRSLVLHKNANSDDYRGTLTLKREMLSPRDFESLHLSASEDCKSVLETPVQENKRCFRFIVSTHSEELCDRSVAVEYHRNGKRKKLRIPFQLAENDLAPRLRPPSFVAVIPGRTEHQDTKRFSRKVVQVSSSKNWPVRILDVKIHGESQENLLRWEIDPNTRDRLLVWVEELPQKGCLMRAALELSVRSGNDNTIRSLVLPCYVSVEPDVDSSESVLASRAPTVSSPR